VTSRPAAAQRLRDLARLRRVRDRIDREYAQRLDVEALARGAHMSAGQLSREFRPGEHRRFRPVLRGELSGGQGEGLPDQSEGRRHDNSGTRALGQAGGDQYAEIRGETAGGGGGQEEGQAPPECLPGTDPVRDRTGGQQQRGQRQGVAVDDPLLSGDPAIEIVPDAR
jgi:hypothetical protein